MRFELSYEDTNLESICKTTQQCLKDFARELENLYTARYAKGGFLKSTKALVCSGIIDEEYCYMHAKDVFKTTLLIYGVSGFEKLNHISRDGQYDAKMRDVKRMVKKAKTLSAEEVDNLREQSRADDEVLESCKTYADYRKYIIENIPNSGVEEYLSQLEK